MIFAVKARIKICGNIYKIIYNLALPDGGGGAMVPALSTVVIVQAGISQISLKSACYIMMSAYPQQFWV